MTHKGLDSQRTREMALLPHSLYGTALGAPIATPRDPVDQPEEPGDRHHTREENNCIGHFFSSATITANVSAAAPTASAARCFRFDRGIVSVRPDECQTNLERFGDLPRFVDRNRTV